MIRYLLGVLACWGGLLIATGCDRPKASSGVDEAAPPASATTVSSAAAPAPENQPVPAAGETAPSAIPPPEAVLTKSEPVRQNWKSIEGGREHRFAGVAFEVPPGWSLVQQGNVVYTVPPDTNQAALEEVYGFIGEPTVKSIDGAEIEMYLDQAVMQLLQVYAPRAGPGIAVPIGGVPGKMWKWTATLVDGRNVEVRAWGFVGSYAAAFVTISTPETLNRREPSLAAIRGSIRRPAAAVLDSGRLVGTWVRAFGSGSLMIGSANEQRITFDANGRFHYHAEGTSHGLFHRGSSQTDVYGIWRLQSDQLSATADSGESKSFTLEARTEAGTGAAVIAIDGTEFRHSHGRAW